MPQHLISLVVVTSDPFLMTGHSRSRASVPRSVGEAAPAATTARSRSAAHRHYAQRRNREIAYGRWQPWVSAVPVRDHVRLLRASGLSYQAIARAAGVSPMTVRRLLHGQPSRQQDIPPRIRTAQAKRLLAINDGTLRQAAVRRNAAGTRRRLQALIAMGHPAVSLARRLDMAPRTVSDIVSGMTATVSPGTHVAVRRLYEQMWDQCPPERTPSERRAAAAARRRAAQSGWPTPMGLDDDLIDDPAYRPRAQWRPAAGASTCGAAVTDHEPDPIRAVAEAHDQVTGLLSGPRAGWMQGDAEDTAAPGGALGSRPGHRSRCRQAARLRRSRMPGLPRPGSAGTATRLPRFAAAPGRFWLSSRSPMPSPQPSLQGRPARHESGGSPIRVLAGSARGTVP